MAVRVPYRAAACGILTACGLHLLLGGALAQTAGSANAPGLREDDTIGLRRDDDSRLSDQRLTQPADARRLSSGRLSDPGLVDNTIRIRPDATLEGSPVLPPIVPDANRIDADTEADSNADERIDLSNNPGVSRRENLRDPAAAPASAIVDAGAQRGNTPLRNDDAAENASEADLFRAIGPVRSPTLDEVGNRRLSDGLPTLRRVPADGNARDPFAPVGTRVGSFLGYLTLDQSLGASDNLTLSRDGRKGTFSQTTLSGRLISDWARHEAELNMAATYRRNFAGPVQEEPQIDADGRVRLDLTRDMTATLRGAVSFGREDDFTSDAARDAASRADILRYSFSADLAARFGRLDTTTTLQAVREDLSDRARTGLRPDDSFTTYTAGLKASLGDRGALHPFLSASLGRRVFDQASPGGVTRDSVIPALRGGVGFDRGEKFSGELAVGYAWNLPDDDALPTHGSPTIDALLNWSPKRGTNVTLQASTVFDPETSGLDTATLYQLSLALRHRATARLDFTAALVAGLRDREQVTNEFIYSGEAGFTYWLTRHLGLTGLYRYDRFQAALSSNSYDANTVRLGVRLQN